MALEDSVTALTSQAGLLLDLPQQIADTADAKMTAMHGTYADLISKLTSTWYVDQANGSDENAGTQASPFATIAKALNVAPSAGRTTVRLLGPYEVRQLTNVDRPLRIESEGSHLYPLTFLADGTFSSDNSVRYTHGFRIGSQPLVFNQVDFQLPAVGTQGARSIGSAAHVIRVNPSVEAGLVSVAIINSQIYRPASPLGRLISHTGRPLILATSGNTLGGAAMEGYWSDRQTNTAGVAPSSLPWLLTGDNVTTI